MNLKDLKKEIDAIFYGNKDYWNNEIEGFISMVIDQAFEVFEKETRLKREKAEVIDDISIALKSGWNRAVEKQQELFNKFRD
jgi:hypothetical protein